MKLLKIPKMLKILGVCFTLFTAQTNAAYIVNTGEGPGGATGGWSLYNDGPNGQWLAGMFSIDQEYTINSVEGWMSLGSTGETLTAALYTADGSVPGLELFSSEISVMQMIEAAWEGAFGLDWLVGPGDYFLAFEVRDGQTFDGAMPDPVSAPLDGYASKSITGGTDWASAAGLDFGMRIDATAVPNPATILLMLPALMFLVRRNKR